jgi:hypothetical protein
MKGEDMEKEIIKSVLVLIQIILLIIQIASGVNWLLIPILLIMLVNLFLLDD